jgi:hypothetical protein
MTGLPRRALVVAVLLAAGGTGTVGCRGHSHVAWADLPTSPGATAIGDDPQLTGPLAERLTARLDERGLAVLGRRYELLPAGVSWVQHLAYRAAHAAGLDRRRDEVPEPDAPVLTAEWTGDDRTLFVIAKATVAGDRLVVLTALTAPR